MNMRTIAFAILVTLIAQPALAVTYADRVQETSTTTGTGNMTLLGAVTRASVLTDDNALRPLRRRAVAVPVLKEDGCRDG